MKKQFVRIVKQDQIFVFLFLSSEWRSWKISEWFCKRQRSCSHCSLIFLNFFCCSWFSTNISSSQVFPFKQISSQEHAQSIIWFIYCKCTLQIYFDLILMFLLANVQDILVLIFSCHFVEEQVCMASGLLEQLTFFHGWSSQRKELKQLRLTHFICYMPKSIINCRF